MRRAGRAAGQGVIAAMALVTASCDRGAPAPVTRGPLPPGVAARVGPIEITADQVARIAGAQGISLAEARDRAVGDAILVRGALDRGLDRAPAVEQEITAELARRMSRKILADARATPPTEEELKQAAARKWLDVDRPEGFRTVHAVVRYDRDKDDDTKKAQARAVAEAIHAAAAPIAERAATMPLPEGAPLPSVRQPAGEDPDPLSSAFRKAAAAVPHGALDVTIEPLPAITASGRVLVASGEGYDPEFSAAAAALPARGALSPVVLTPFGFHVILLLERTPAQILQGEARFRRLRDDVANERARAAEKKLLAAIRPRAAVQPDAPGLLDLVRVEP